MNRRSFFKFLGIGAAAATVAPKMLTTVEPALCATGAVTLPPRKTYEALYPPEVRISDTEWRWFEYLRRTELEQLGLKDIQWLKRTRRNA